MPDVVLVAGTIYPVDWKALLDAQAQVRGFSSVRSQGAGPWGFTTGVAIMPIG